MREGAEVRVSRELYQPSIDRPGPRRLAFSILVKGPVGKDDQVRARRLAEAEALTWSEELGVPKPQINFDSMASNWNGDGTFSYSAFYVTNKMIIGEEVVNG